MGKVRKVFRLWDAKESRKTTIPKVLLHDSFTTGIYVHSCFLATSRLNGQKYPHTNTHFKLTILFWSRKCGIFFINEWLTHCTDKSEAYIRVLIRSRLSIPLSLNKATYLFSSTFATNVSTTSKRLSEKFSASQWGSVICVSFAACWFGEPNSFSAHQLLCALNSL